MIGTYNSACAQVEIPILNRAPGGPLAMISPANTYPGLTRPGLPPPWGYRGEPDVFYPTGTRNYVRVLPPDDMHGAAHALLAKDLGLRNVYLLYDDSEGWEDLLIDPFRYAARRLDVPIAGSAASTRRPRASTIWRSGSRARVRMAWCSAETRTSAVTGC